MLQIERPLDCCDVYISLKPVVLHLMKGRKNL